MVVTLEIYTIFEIDFIKAMEHFFCVYIASSEHSTGRGAGRILESYANP